MSKDDDAYNPVIVVETIFLLRSVQHRYSTTIRSNDILFDNTKSQTYVVRK